MPKTRKERSMVPWQRSLVLSLSPRVLQVGSTTSPLNWAWPTSNTSSGPGQPYAGSSPIGEFGGKGLAPPQMGDCLSRMWTLEPQASSPNTWPLFSWRTQSFPLDGSLRWSAAFSQSDLSGTGERGNAILSISLLLDRPSLTLAARIRNEPSQSSILTDVLFPWENTGFNPHALFPCLSVALPIRWLSMIRYFYGDANISMILEA